MTVTSLREFAQRYDADEKRVPDWTLGDRMTKAMKMAGMNVGQMAEIFDVDRNTVSRWLNDKVRPKPMVLMFWADGCGVDLEWIETGVPSVEASKVAAVRALDAAKAATPKGDGLSQSVRHQGLEPRTRCLSAYASDDVNVSLTANRRGPILRAVAA